MDDIWQCLNLESIGIPITNMIKIVFTTRDRKVCVDMRSQKPIFVGSLNEEESLKLFKNHLDSTEILQDTQFENYAKQIVKKCDGLPLAIITIGRAMADSKNIKDWVDMIDMLNNSLQEIDDMDSVMKILKVSYDKLKDDRFRSGLLYCCLYPEDDDIKIESLIDHWIGEGLVESHRIGRQIIKKLISACLLEVGFKDEYVKMHDVVREMALWLTNIDSNNYVKVYNTSPIVRNLPNYDEWDKAKKISLMGYNLESLPNSKVPKCPNLVTLLLIGNHNFCKFPMVNFFNSMPNLCVLDLSYNRALEEIPSSIGSLVNLQYLNLYFTSIVYLPKEVGNLVKLRILCMVRCAYDWKSEENKGQLIFKDLEKLKHLDDFDVDVKSKSDLQTLVDNPILSKATRELVLEDIDFNDADMKFIGSNFSKLQTLYITNCSNLRRIWFFGTQPLFLLKELYLFGLNILSINVKDKDATIVNHNNCLLPNLRMVEIQNCSMLKDVMWTTKLPSLEELQLGGCAGMETILVVGNNDEVQDARVEGTSRVMQVQEERYHNDNSYFLKLTKLVLQDLPSLKSISKPAFPLLLFPSLKVLDVLDCPKLENICLAQDVKDKVATMVNHNCLLPNLCKVTIIDCKMLKDVTWMAELPSLKELQLGGCDGMETILVVGNDNEAQDERVEGKNGVMQVEEKRYHSDNTYFPKLTKLGLFNLPSLKSISKLAFPLLFPSLKKLDVHDCPKLENICLRPDSAKDMKRIEGEQEWWDELKWEDEETKATFLPCFKPFSWE